MNGNEIVFIKCPVAGAVHIKEGKRNGLHVFDSISFVARDANDNSYEIEGLLFDEEKGWYESDAVIPKYYGKGVYAACVNYAVDMAIRDNLLLQLAIFGKERPAKAVLTISHSETVQRLNAKGFIVS